MNCLLAITCVLALATSTKADGLGALGGHGLGGLGGLVYAPGHASVDYYAYPRYAFEYAVKDPHTGDNKAQWEKRDGDVVKGAYSLVEPDGSLRVVEYWADDKSGFNAVVKRLGPNLHPVAAPVAPIYKAPIPVLDSHGPVAPISVGPVAGYSGLANAPLISGPILGGGAVSSASVYRAPIVPVVKAVAPIAAPIAPAPILPAPVAHAPILSAPVYKAPIISAPLPAPIVAAPAVGLGGLGLGGLGHLGNAGHLESVGYLGGAGHLGGSGYLGGAAHIGSAGHLGGVGHLGGIGLGGLGYGSGLIKAPLAGHGYLEDLGHGLLNKGPIGGLGHNYLGGYKH